VWFWVVELVFDYWQRWAPFVKDTRLSSNCSVFQDRLDIKGIFLGSEQQLGDLLDGIKRLPGTFTQTEKAFSQWFVSHRARNNLFKSTLLDGYHKPIPREGLKAIYNHVLVAPSPQSNFFALAWGGHTRIVPKGGTAFPKSHRKALFYAEPGVEFSDVKITAQALDWVETLRLQLSPYFKGGYCNVLDRAILQYGKEYYGKRNYEKLQKIKKKYDPTNVFHFEQSVAVWR
jgi:hypothetical protein